MNEFTPAPDHIVKELGPIAALIWGRVWRYAQQDDGECWASQTKIANELNISDKTVNRHIKKLIDAGYLVEIYSANGTTNHYKPQTNCPWLNGEPRTICPTTTDKKSALPRTKSPTKIQFKKQPKIDIKDIDPFDEMQALLETMTGRIATQADIKDIQRAVKEGVIKDDIEGALAWRIAQGLKPISRPGQIVNGAVTNKAKRIQVENASKPIQQIPNVEVYR